MNTLSTLFEESVRQFGNRTAVNHTSGSKITYGEMGRCVIELSENLMNAGLSKGDHVGIFLPNGVAFIIAYWAIQRAGATAVLTSATYKPWDLRRIQDSCDIGWWLTDFYRLPFLVDGVDATTFHASSFGGICYVHRFQAPKPDQSVVAASVILPTSGSTGTLKPVMLGSDAIAWNAITYGKDIGINEKDRSLVLLPLTSAFAHTTQMVCHFLTGGEIILGPDLFIPQTVLEIIKQVKPTIMGIVPSAFRRILACLIEPRSLFPKTVLAGEYADIQVIDSCKRLLPGSDIIRAYGLSEAGPRVAQRLINWDAIADESVGRPLPGIDLKIIDDHGQQLPPNTTGEIQVRTPSLMQGYYKDAFGTARVIKDAWLSTGDIGSVDRYGSLTVTGRTKNLVVRGGIKISPEEIEAFLLSLPGVEGAVVFVRQPVQDMAYLVAYVTSHGKTPLRQDELLVACRQNLSPVKIPNEINIIDSLPISTSGKLDRKKIIERDSIVTNLYGTRTNEQLTQ